MLNEKLTSDGKNKVRIKLDEILKRYDLLKFSEDIFNILKDSVALKIKDADIPELIVKKTKTDLAKAYDCAFDLIEEILRNNELVDDLQEQAGIKEDETNKDASGPSDLLRQINFPISDPVIKRRFDVAIVSWLRDIRDLDELKEVLTKPVKIGGVGIPNEIIDQLYELLLTKREELKASNLNLNQIEAVNNNGGIQNNDIEIDVAAKVAPLPTTQPKPASADVNIDQLLQQKRNSYQATTQPEPKTEAFKPAADLLSQDIAAEEDFLLSRKELVAPQKPSQPMARPEERVPISMPVPEVEQNIQTYQNSINNPPIVKKPLASDRPKVEDVKFASRVYGPVDELAALKIDDFRRLSKDPTDAVKKILNKIELLEEESMVKRNEGVKALKSSPLYKSYATIMNTAMMQGKSFEEVIAANPTISLAEFKAVMDLNKTLKY